MTTNGHNGSSAAKGGFPARPVAALATVAVASALTAVAVSWLLPPSPPPEPLTAVPPTLVEQTPFEESRGAADLSARKRAILEGYGWVDRKAGIARIPIEDAFRLTIEREASEAKKRKEEEGN